MQRRNLPGSKRGDLFNWDDTKEPGEERFGVFDLKAKKTGKKKKMNRDE